MPRAFVFDAYGTLFDVHAPVNRLAAEIGPKAEELSRLWRQKQLEYTWLRSLMGAHADFWKVTSEALAYALAVENIDDPGLKDELMRRGKVYYAKVLKKRSTLVSVGLVPVFHALYGIARRDEAERLSPDASTAARPWWRPAQHEPWRGRRRGSAGPWPRSPRSTRTRSPHRP